MLIASFLDGVLACTQPTAGLAWPLRLSGIGYIGLAGFRAANRLLCIKCWVGVGSDLRNSSWVLDIRLAGFRPVNRSLGNGGFQTYITLYPSDTTKTMHP